MTVWPIGPEDGVARRMHFPAPGRHAEIKVVQGHSSRDLSPLLQGEDESKSLALYPFAVSTCKNSPDVV